MSSETARPTFGVTKAATINAQARKSLYLKKKDKKMIMLKIMLYAYRSCVFKTKKVSIPGSHEVALFDDGRSSETKARLKFDLDNENQRILSVLSFYQLKRDVRYESDLHP